MATETFEIKVDSSGAVTGARKAENALDKLGKSAVNVDKGVKSTERSVSSLAKSLIGPIGLAAAFAVTTKAVTASIQSYREYEKALVGVAKTTNLGGKELAKFSANIKQLSKDLKGAASSKELLAIAQAAGQLGVTGTKNLEKFAKTIAKLGQASDLAGDIAATTLTRILTVTGEGVGSIDIFASQIVALGNNFAATESEIARVANEVSRATAVFNVSAGSSAALAAALKSVGVQAELGGSTVGKAFRVIDSAVRNGGKALKDLAELSGVTGDQLKKTFQEDSVAAFTLFVEGLGRVSKSGGDTTAELAKFGLKGEEVLKVLPVLAKNSDLVARALRTVRDEATNGGQALEKEFAAAVDTLDAKIKNLDQRFDDLKTSAGKAFEDVANDSIDMATTVVKSIDFIFQRQERLRKILAFGRAEGFKKSSAFGTPEEFKKLEKAYDDYIAKLKKPLDLALNIQSGDKPKDVQERGAAGLVAAQESMIASAEKAAEIQKKASEDASRIDRHSVSQRDLVMRQILQDQEELGKQSANISIKSANEVAKIEQTSIIQRAYVMRQLMQDQDDIDKQSANIAIKSAEKVTKTEQTSIIQRAFVMRQLINESNDRKSIIELENSSAKERADVMWGLVKQKELSEADILKESIKTAEEIARISASQREEAKSRAIDLSEQGGTDMNAVGRAFIQGDTTRTEKAGPDLSESIAAFSTGVGVFLEAAKKIADFPKMAANMVNGILDAFASWDSTVERFFDELPQRIESAFLGVADAIARVFTAEMGGLIINAFESFATGFIDGIKAIFGQSIERGQSLGQTAELKGLAKSIEDQAKSIDRSGWGSSDWQSELSSLTQSKANLDRTQADFWDQFIEISQNEFDAIKQLNSIQEEALTTLRGVLGTLDDTINSLLGSTFNPDQTFISAQAAYDQLLSDATASGLSPSEREEAVGGLTSFVQGFLEKAQQQFGSSADYQTLFSQVLTDLDAAKALVTTEIGTAQTGADTSGTLLEALAGGISGAIDESESTTGENALTKIANLLGEIWRFTDLIFRPIITAAGRFYIEMENFFINIWGFIEGSFGTFITAAGIFFIDTGKVLEKIRKLLDVRPGDAWSGAQATLDDAADLIESNIPGSVDVPNALSKSTGEAGPGAVTPLENGYVPVMVNQNNSEMISVLKQQNSLLLTLINTTDKGLQIDGQSFNKRVGSISDNMMRERVNRGIGFDQAMAI